MVSIFSGLPNNLIIKIIQIDNDRKKYEKERMKFRSVISELIKLSGRHCDLDEGYWYGWPWIRPAADIVDLVV